MSLAADNNNISSSKQNEADENYDAHELHMYRQSIELPHQAIVLYYTMRGNPEYERKLEEINKQTKYFDGALLRSRWHKVTQKTRGCEHFMLEFHRLDPDTGTIIYAVQGCSLQLTVRSEHAGIWITWQTVEPMEYARRGSLSFDRLLKKG
jgi:hypothetical protein